MSYPLVSVLIPCYNHEKYIIEALNSIISDTYPNKEIVIIDDGSKDNSSKLIESWIGLNKELINVKCISRPNKGVCATLNELIDIAEGKYVLLLASDDALYGNTILNRVKILEDKEIEGKMVVVSDALVIDENSSVIMQSAMSEHGNGNKEKYKTDEGILEEVILNPSIHGAVVLINKNIYKLIGKYPIDMNTEDWFFYQRAAALKAIYFWDMPVSFYRIHSSNTSRVFSKTQTKLVKSIIKTLYANLSWFPGFKYKYYCIKQIIRYNMILVKILLRNAIIQEKTIFVIS